MRHLHPAPISRAGRRQRLPPPLRDRQGPRRHRGHLAVQLRLVVLAQRARPEQRTQRHRPGAVGHQGQGGRNARLRPVGREGAGRRRRLRPRRRQRASGGGGPGPRLHRSRAPPRQGADGHARDSSHTAPAAETRARPGRGRASQRTGPAAGLPGRAPWRRIRPAYSSRRRTSAPLWRSSST